MKLSYKRNVRPGNEPGWLIDLTYEVMKEFEGRELKEEDYDTVFDYISSTANTIMATDTHIRSVISVYRLGETAGGKYPIFIARNDTLIQTFYIS